MTLFKQIALLVFFVFSLLLILISIDNFQKSGLFLRGQMQTTANDTATVLGIAISNTGYGEDIAALETLFNAVFDSGYYSDIRLVSTNGKIIHQKRRSLKLENIPDWFISAVPLPRVTGNAQVMQGWKPLGSVELTLHPGYAYAGLYQNLISTSLWFLALFFLALILIWYVLHIILKPLKHIREQADAIHNNQFIQQNKLPKTKELRRVVEGMNRLVSKVQQVFNEQEKILNQYQEPLYKDSLTGLYNRRYIMSELDKVLSESAIFQGDFIIVKVLGIDFLREQKGYIFADKTIQSITKIIIEQMTQNQDINYARLSDNEFALLIPNNSEKNYSAKLVEEIFSSRKDEQYKEIFESIVLVAGITHIHSGRQVSDILAELDLALSQSEASGGFEYRIVESTHLVLPKGKMQWRDWLQTSIDENKFYLVAQPVFNQQKEIIQLEAFVRINDSNEQMIPAGVFMPMALTLGYGLAIDKTVFKLFEKLVNQQNQIAPLAINLSLPFFEHFDGLKEFKELLVYYKSNTLDLHVEASHASFQKHPEIFTEVAKMTKQAGQLFGVDHLDLNGDLQVLQKVSPDYIKINAIMLRELGKDSQSAGYQALKTLTTTLDIQIIAVGVDEENLYKQLLTLNVDGVQGNLLAEPEELK